MAIKELTKKFLGKTKTGWFWDRRRELFVTYQVDTQFNGERHIRRGFRSEKEAKDYIEQLKTQERLKQIGVVQIIKFPKVKDLFECHRATLLERKQQTVFDRVTNKFISLLNNPNLTLDELRRKHFKDFSDTRIKEGIKAESANREITELSAAIHSAGDYFENLENWSVPRNLIYRPSFESTERDRVITLDERQRLIEYLLNDKKQSEREKDFIARRRAGLVLFFGLLTGLRHGEISALQKKEFDRDRRRLRAERFKTRKSGVRWTVFEPLSDTQLWVLAEADKLYPTGDYFFSATGKKHNKIYTTIRTACERLEISYGKNAADGFVIHDARHTFVTVLEHGGIDSSTTRSFSGHSKDSMLKRYAHATVDSRARAMQTIEREIGINILNGNGTASAELKRIYEQVRAGKMTFAEFRKSLENSLTVF